ncbi:MAG: hypothetical protein ABSB22_26560 [Thermodesulfobacteriota bacterium]
MKSAISQTVSKWVEEESHQRTLALKVIRKNDPWRDMLEEEIEDSKEFIRCYLLRDFELLLQIPTEPRENDFWFSNHQEFMESAFNTHDFQKDKKPFDKYGYRNKKVLEQIKDMAILHSCISQAEGRDNIYKRYKSIIENEFRVPILELVNRLNKVTDREKRSEIIPKIVKLNYGIFDAKTIWQKYSSHDG